MNRTDADAQHPAPQAVRVVAPARLHLGFLDPAGSLGRPWGSVGLVIDGLPTEVEIAAAARDEFCAGDGLAGELERAAEHVAGLRRHTGRNAPLRLTLASAPPGHAGFGSGTQLALAVGRAFARWQRIDVPTSEIARWLGRGLRSGVGIAGFDQGGLLVDGGPGADGSPAPLVARVELPADWRVVLVLDPRRRGLSGAEERHALATLPPLARAVAADLCHQVLMRVLPGAAGNDFETFASGLTALQQRLGEHFAPAQGGSAWSSPAVGRAMAWIAEARGSAGAAIGQSSWGPTGFAVLPTPAAAEALLASARSARALDPALVVRVVRGCNRGARIGDDRS
ncbi:MAG TPA: beta-ribofuranosylaminobenzene 5'-phosphate synthase family protein [Ideonella sp.]|nr:beta-ribofuranosylaminobenzene 5'-phosphate synthase family protein [Ideonella sp.]